MKIKRKILLLITASSRDVVKGQVWVYQLP